MVQLPRLRASCSPTTTTSPASARASSCGNGFQFSSALGGVRAQIQLLRNYADTSSLDQHHPRSAGARALGQQPGDRGLQLRPLLRQGHGAALERHGQRQLGELARTTRPSCWASTTRCSSPAAIPGQCPPDGLLFGPLTAAGPCPVSLRQPGRAIATTLAGGIYVLNGNGSGDRVQRRARTSARRRFADSDSSATSRSCPTATGYVVLDRDGLRATSSARATDRRRRSGRSAMRRTRRGDDVGRVRSRSRPTARATSILLADGDVYKAGTAATGALAALGHPVWSATTRPQHRGRCPTARATSCSTSSAACGSTAARPLGSVGDADDAVLGRSTSAATS